MSQSDLMTALQKLLPWSLCIELGTPNVLTTSLTKVFANVLDEVSLNGNVSTHFVKRSVTTRMYLFPLRVTGSGPIMSHAIFSKGCDVTMGIKGVFAPCTGFRC